MTQKERHAKAHVEYKRGRRRPPAPSRKLNCGAGCTQVSVTNLDTNSAESIASVTESEFMTVVCWVYNYDILRSLSQLQP